MSGTGVPSPALQIVIAGLIEDREHKGKEWCGRHGVGARRRNLGLSATNVLTLSSSKAPEIVEHLRSQQEAQKHLADICAACTGCKAIKP